MRSTTKWLPTYTMIPPSICSLKQSAVNALGVCCVMQGLPNALAVFSSECDLPCVTNLVCACERMYECGEGISIRHVCMSVSLETAEHVCVECRL